MVSPNPSSQPSAGTVPVPLESLAVEGVPPAQGDSVQFTVAGRIVSIDGATAQVQVETVNEQPVAMDDAAQDRAMMEAAERADADMD